MDDLRVKCEMLFGHVTIHTTRRVEGDKLILGGFSRHYDWNGQLVRETEPEDYVVVHNWCAAPHQQSAPKRGLVSRLIAWCSK